jgi:hypothetical protein
VEDLASGVELDLGAVGVTKRPAGQPDEDAYPS